MSEKIADTKSKILKHKAVEKAFLKFGPTR